MPETGFPLSCDFVGQFPKYWDDRDDRNRALPAWDFGQHPSPQKEGKMQVMQVLAASCMTGACKIQADREGGADEGHSPPFPSSADRVLSFRGRTECFLLIPASAWQCLVEHALAKQLSTTLSFGSTSFRQDYREGCWIHLRWLQDGPERLDTFDTQAAHREVRLLLTACCLQVTSAGAGLEWRP